MHASMKLRRRKRKIYYCLFIILHFLFRIIKLMLVNNICICLYCSATNVRWQQRRDEAIIDDDVASWLPPVHGGYRRHNNCAGKLASPCGPTRVPHQHAGPGPPLLPGKVRQLAAPNSGDTDLQVSQNQKDEWFVQQQVSITHLINHCLGVLEHIPAYPNITPIGTVRIYQDEIPVNIFL